MYTVYEKRSFHGFTFHSDFCISGIGDKTMMGDRAGCVELLNTVTSRVQPKLHVFGHIHEGTLNPTHFKHTL